MYAIGIVTPTIGIRNFDFAVSVSNIPYFVKNAEDVVIEDGQPVVIQYEPADQFCAVVPFDKVAAILIASKNYTRQDGAYGTDCDLKNAVKELS